MIGNVLQKYRFQNHLSQAQMAKKLDVSPSYISSLERGVRNAAGRPYIVSGSVLERMSKATGIPISVLEKEVHEQPQYLTDPLNDEETDLILRFRRADAETKAMIRRLLRYMKNEELSKHGKK